jgi:hypothetical protein
MQFREVDDSKEARALSYRNNYTDIYVAAWGPDDDGLTTEGPGPQVREVLISGTTHVYSAYL